MKRESTFRFLFLSSANVSPYKPEERPPTINDFYVECNGSFYPTMLSRYSSLDLRRDAVEFYDNGNVHYVDLLLRRGKNNIKVGHPSPSFADEVGNRNCLFDFSDFQNWVGESIGEVDFKWFAPMNSLFVAYQSDTNTRKASVRELEDRGTW